MPFLFVDLDNTVVDRAGAVRRWADRFAAERSGRPAPELADAIFEADGNGTRPKPHVADDLERILGLTPAEKESIIAVLRAGVITHLQPDPSVNTALAAAREAGWTPFVVTNGEVAQQNSTVDTLGLRDLIDGMVISEGVGVAKPDPRIFEIAAREGGGSLEGAWMVGDTPAADVKGAHAAGVKAAWIDNGYWSWPAELPRPEVHAHSFAEAVDAIIAAR